MRRQTYSLRLDKALIDRVRTELSGDPNIRTPNGVLPSLIESLLYKWLSSDQKGPSNQ